ncbi:hypothetical protein VNO78_20185 [Psophocarpus tetragonolobus]|uniref:Uncharacterized protein n=1 Tax=Psophocarpus tetragonolobus TaxID=3891 RepID=A0AAN9XGW1_PSOTE
MMLYHFILFFSFSYLTKFIYIIVSIFFLASLSSFIVTNYHSAKFSDAAFRVPATLPSASSSSGNSNATDRSSVGASTTRSDKLRWSSPIAPRQPHIRRRLPAFDSSCYPLLGSGLGSSIGPRL